MTRAGAPKASGDGAEGVVRNAAFAFAGQIATATFTAGLTIYLARALGTGGYGVFALAVGIGALCLLPADFGISAATARFVAEQRADRPGVAALLAAALRLKLLSGGAVAIVLFAAAGGIAAAFGKSGLAWPLRGVAIAILAQSLMGFAVTQFTALGRVSVSLRAIVAESSVETGASVALVLLGAGATGAAFGRAIGYVVGALVALALLARTCGRAAIVPRRAPRAQARALVGYAGALLVIDGAFTLFNQIDVLLIGALLASSKSVALFEAPMKLTALLAYPGLSTAAGVAPRLAGARAGSPSVDRLGRAIRWLVLLQALVIVPIVVWAGPIIDLVLGPDYADSAAVLRALAPFIFLAGLAPLVSLGVNYLGEARRRVPIAIATVVANGAIDAVLIPTIGIVGGAIGTDVAYALYVPAHFWICRRMLDLPLRPVLLTTLRALVAAAAAGGVLAAFGTHDLSPLAWVAGPLAAVATYGATLIATGELRPAELRAARSRLRERARARAPRNAPPGV